MISPLKSFLDIVYNEEDHKIYEYFEYKKILKL